MATLLLNQTLMITSSIIDAFHFRLSSDSEFGLVLFVFLFPAIWGAALAFVAFFQDLNRAPHRSKGRPERLQARREGLATKS